MIKDTQKLKGSLVAIVTPMNDDGSLDIPSYKKLIAAIVFTPVMNGFTARVWFVYFNINVQI